MWHVWGGVGELALSVSHVWFLIMGGVQHPNLGIFGTETFSSTTIIVMSWCCNMQCLCNWYMPGQHILFYYGNYAVPFHLNYYIPIANSYNKSSLSINTPKIRIYWAPEWSMGQILGQMVHLLLLFVYLTDG